MIKQIISNEVVEHIKNNPQSVLLDVRTEEEWNVDGKPEFFQPGFAELPKNPSEIFVHL